MPAVLLWVLMNELETTRANELLWAYRASYSDRAFCWGGHSRDRESVRGMMLVCLCWMEWKEEAINWNVFSGNKTFYKDMAAKRCILAALGHFTRFVGLYLRGYIYGINKPSICFFYHFVWIVLISKAIISLHADIYMLNIPAKWTSLPLSLSPSRFCLLYASPAPRAAWVSVWPPGPWSPGGRPKDGQTRPQGGPLMPAHRRRVLLSIFALRRISVFGRCLSTSRD